MNKEFFSEINDKFNSNNNDNNFVNNEVTNSEYFTDFLEMIDYLNKLKKLLIEYKAIADKEDRFEINEKINKLKSRLSHYGVTVDISDYVSQAANTIFNYFKKFNISKSYIENRVMNAQTNVTAMYELHLGCASTFSDKICFDIKYVNFDEQGNFTNIKEEEKREFCHALCHECFHLISRNDHILAPQGINEGMTEMFTCKANGSYDIKSASYDFPVRICELFVEMLGEDTIVQEYMSCDYLYSSICNLFGDRENFNSFSNKLSDFINHSKDVDIDEQLRLFLIKLSDDVVIPFCKNNPSDGERVISTFNDLFKKNQVNINISDVYNDSHFK